MNQLSPSYFHYLDLPVTHELKQPAPSLETRQEIMEFFPKRVSEKLLLNRLRKLEIQQKKHKEKELLVEKRLSKQRGILELFKKRELIAQERREQHLRAESVEAPFKELQEVSVQKLSKFHASQAIITKCRQNVEQKKQQYVARIQTRTRERQQKAGLRRRQMRENVEKANDEIHLQQWRNYETQILQRRTQHSPPDRLYQQYKKRREQLDWALSFGQDKENKEERKEKENKENKEEKENKEDKEDKKEKEDKEKVEMEARQRATEMPKASTPKSTLFRSRRVEYFGVHQGDAMKKTESDMAKMRKFIQDHSWASEPERDEQLLLKFEQFLRTQLLRL